MFNNLVTCFPSHSLLSDDFGSVLQQAICCSYTSVIHCGHRPYFLYINTCFVYMHSDTGGSGKVLTNKTLFDAYLPEIFIFPSNPCI